MIAVQFHRENKKVTTRISNYQTLVDILLKLKSKGYLIVKAVGSTFNKGSYLVTKQNLIISISYNVSK